jgi:hypothetical protein
MTFAGLLLRFVIGYVFGLLARPLVSRSFSRYGDASIHGGIAGGLGASVPYVLLNSIWSDRVPLALTGHEHRVSAIVCLLAIAATEIIAGPSRIPEARTTPEEPVAAILDRSKRKAATWLWLCVPALGYRLWHFFFGEYPTNPWIVYAFGALTLIGLVGWVVAYSVSFLRATK